MICSTVTRADCDDSGITFHEKNYSIYISQDCYVYKQIEYINPKGKSISIPFATECKSKDHIISCRKHGITPLAGATYKQVDYGKSNYESSRYRVGDPLHRYECIKGCSVSTPKHSETSE